MKATKALLALAATTCLTSAAMAQEIKRVATVPVGGEITGMFLQGSTMTSVPFRDGILCAGNPTERLEVVSLDANGAATSSADVEEPAQLLPGQTATYQFWYRDPVLSPCGTGSNFSSAFAVEWL